MSPAPAIPLDAGRARQKQRTRKELLRAARDLLALGRQPGVAEVADHAGISRATAYRYFASAESMVSEAMLDAMAAELDRFSVAQPALAPGEVPEAAAALIGGVLSLVLQNEAVFRSYLAQAVTPSGQVAHPRGGRRVEWAQQVLAPLAGLVEPAVRARLVAALSLLTGIETVVVLRDVCGLPPAELEATCRWIGTTLVESALRSPPAPGAESC